MSTLEFICQRIPPSPSISEKIKECLAVDQIIAGTVCVAFARYDGVASLSKSLLRRCATRAREPLSECSSCRNFEFLYLAWPWCWLCLWHRRPLRKRQPLPPLHNRKLPPVARWLLIWIPTKWSIRTTRIWCVRLRLSAN